MISNGLRAIAGAVLVATLSVASPALAQNIAEPEVTKGQSKLETFSVWQGGLPSVEDDTTRQLHTLNYTRGITDIWQIKAWIALDQPAGDDWRLSLATIENTFELLNAKRGGIGLS